MAVWSMRCKRPCSATRDGDRCRQRCNPVLDLRCDVVGQVDAAIGLGLSSERLKVAQHRWSRSGRRIVSCRCTALGRRSPRLAGMRTGPSQRVARHSWPRLHPPIAVGRTTKNAVARDGISVALLSGLSLCRWPPEDHQLADAARQPEPRRDQQTPPAVQEVVEARRAEDRIVQAEPTGPDRGYRYR